MRVAWILFLLGLLVPATVTAASKRMPSALSVGEHFQLADKGWHKIVRSRDENESTWVFSRHRDDGSMTGIFVVDLDDDELSIVAVEGRLDEILADAIADEPGEFSRLFGS